HPHALLLPLYDLRRDVRQTGDTRLDVPRDGVQRVVAGTRLGELSQFSAHGRDLSLDIPKDVGFGASGQICPQRAHGLGDTSQLAKYPLVVAALLSLHRVHAAARFPQRLDTVTALAALDPAEQVVEQPQRHAQVEGDAVEDGSQIFALPQVRGRDQVRAVPK